MSDDSPSTEATQDEVFRPVFAADVPDKVRRALIKSPNFQVPASRVSPSERGLIIKASFASLGITLMGALFGGIVVGILLAIGALLRLLIPFNDTAQQISSWLLAGLGVAVAGAVGIGYSISVESEWMRLPIRRFHGRYFCADDFDKESLALVRRAQNAADSILDSKVYELGMLAEVGNETVLPARIWEVAQLLRIQRDLWERHETANRQVMTPELEAVLKPQREALARSLAAVTKQVEALEEYARLTAVADSAYAAKKLVDVNDEYRGLLTRSGDTEGFGYLAAEAEQVEMRLRSGLAEAITLGRSLAVPPA